MPASSGQAAQCRQCPKGQWCAGAKQPAANCPTNMDTMTTKAKRVLACGELVNARTAASH